ncbi:hypothetical protein JCM8547_008774 [Rhodosporidiobolus lusitaniae]
MSSGKLSKLVELPVDILTEIAEHLDPITLLDMSRASKAFRNIFDARSSRTIWRAARSTVACPTLRRTTCPRWRMRRSCSKRSAMSAERTAPTSSTSISACASARTSDLCPAIWFEIVTAHKDIVLHRWTLACCISTKNAPRPNGCDWFWVPDLRAVNDELHEIQSRINEASGSTVEHPVGSTRAHSYALYLYAELIRPIRAGRRGSSRLDRRGRCWSRASLKDAKRKRLEGLYEWHSDVRKLVDQPRPLTDAIWKRISPEILSTSKSSATVVLREPDEREPIDDESWAAVSSVALEQAKSVTRQFKLKLARVLVSALDGTIHALDPALSAGLSGPAGSDEQETVAVTDEELDDLSKPYKHGLTCGDCPSYAFHDTVEAYSVLRQHGFRGHLLDVEDPGKWYASGWAEVVGEALSLVGLEDDANAEAATTALHAVGTRWVCKGCANFETSLASSNASTTRYGFDTVLRTGRTWSYMVGHILNQHLKAPQGKTLPRLELAPQEMPAEELIAETKRAIHRPISTACNSVTP